MEYSSTPLKYWNSCPFRGIPHIDFDERCPTSIPTFAESVELETKPQIVTTEPRKRGRPRKDEVRPVVEVKKDTTVIMIPILQEGTVCFNCMNNHIREREMGKSVTSFSPIKKNKVGRPRVRR